MFEDDLDLFFDDEEFAEPLTIVSSGSTVSVIVEDPIEAIELGSIQSEIATFSILCKAVHVKALDHKAHVQLRGEDLQITGKTSRGSGLYQLQLGHLDATTKPDEWR